MPDNTTRVEELRRQVYDLQQVVHGLERQLANAEDAATAQAMVDKLAAAQAKAGAAEQELAEAKKQAGTTAEAAAGSGEVTRTRSLATTGLNVVVEPMMASVPTAFYHLLDAEEHPLVKCTVTTTAAFNRVRITSYIEGYSAQAVDTIEVRRNQAPPPVVMQQPTLLLEKVRSINELDARQPQRAGRRSGHRQGRGAQEHANLAAGAHHGAVGDVRPSQRRVEGYVAFPGSICHAQPPQRYEVSPPGRRKHAATRLLGYQDNADVDAQVKAVFDALKSVAEIVYINSLNTFNPNTGERSQRLRLPAKAWTTSRPTASTARCCLLPF